jgi:hypothetical protein
MAVCRRPEQVFPVRSVVATLVTSDPHDQENLAARVLAGQVRCPF